VRADLGHRGRPQPRRRRGRAGWVHAGRRWHGRGRRLRFLDRLDVEFFIVGLLVICNDVEFLDYRFLVGDLFDQLLIFDNLFVGNLHIERFFVGVRLPLRPVELWMPFRAMRRDEGWRSR
jgi:hypothetical protein